MKKSTPDIIISVILLIFFGTLLAQVPQIPSISRTYPLVLIVIAIIMTVVLLVKAIIKSRTETPVETKIVQQAKVIIPYVILITAYLLLLTKIGYVFATIAFMLVSFIYLRFKSKVGMIIISVVTTVLLYYVFRNVLDVILPVGKWINLAL